MDEGEAMAFSEAWLAAWTGNRPEALLAYYSEDAFYRDPGRPQGLRGAAQLRPYFEKLLAANPAWEWRAVETHPTPKGFTLKWHARILAGDNVVEEDGLDIVEVSGGRITRNEVYFDRSALLMAHAAKRVGA